MVFDKVRAWVFSLWSTILCFETQHVSDEVRLEMIIGMEIRIVNDRSHVHLCHDSQSLSFMCAMTHSYVCHDSFICVPWLNHLCAMTHSYLCHDWCIYVPWLIHVWAMSHSYVIRELWLNHMWAMTHSHVKWSFGWKSESWMDVSFERRPGSFVFTILSSVWTSHGTHMNERDGRDSFICVPWLIHIPRKFCVYDSEFCSDNHFT